MLLRGVKFEPPTLNREDIEATKGRASHSGRSHGGAPLGRGRGRGRGGQISYADDRPNPFAAHVNPNFAPPPLGRGVQLPSGGHHNGYSPSVPRYNGPPPSSQNGYYNGPPPPQQTYGRYPGPPPPPPPHFTGNYNNHSSGPAMGYGNDYPGNQIPNNQYRQRENHYGGYNGSGR